MSINKMMAHQCPSFSNTHLSAQPSCQSSRLRSFLNLVFRLLLPILLLLLFLSPPPPFRRRLPPLRLPLKLALSKHSLRQPPHAPIHNRPPGTPTLTCGGRSPSPSRKRKLSRGAHSTSSALVIRNAAKTCVSTAACSMRNRAMAPASWPRSIGAPPGRVRTRWIRGNTAFDEPGGRKEGREGTHIGPVSYARAARGYGEGEPVCDGHGEHRAVLAEVAVDPHRLYARVEALRLRLCEVRERRGDLRAEDGDDRTGGVVWVFARDEGALLAGGEEVMIGYHAQDVDGARGGEGTGECEGEGGGRGRCAKVGGHGLGAVGRGLGENRPFERLYCQRDEPVDERHPLIVTNRRDGLAQPVDFYTDPQELRKVRGQYRVEALVASLPELVRPVVRLPAGHRAVGELFVECDEVCRLCAARKLKVFGLHAQFRAVEVRHYDC
ncbi:hypothetical protein DFH09DRAFT_1138305 [Mycena vulgaris]|nr:hypothetical protein DFH09DRAFT_1138305 [Mycena vulgaris]